VTTRIAVWLDHKEARVFHVHPDSADESTVLAPPHNDHHKHTRGQEGLKEHPEDLNRFYRGLVTAIEGGDELLIAGPGMAKVEFRTFLHTYHPALDAKVVGVETVDHPSDAEMIVFAKTQFKAADRMV
jgi:stalled ribosome rescue protein Dom34